MAKSGKAVNGQRVTIRDQSEGYYPDVTQLTIPGEPPADLDGAADPGDPAQGFSPLKHKHAGGGGGGSNHPTAATGPTPAAGVDTHYLRADAIIPLQDVTVVSGKMALDGLQMPRKATSGGGAVMTWQGQGAELGQTNTAGGSLVLKTGVSTGNAATPAITMDVAIPGISGTGDTFFSERFRADANGVLLTGGQRATSRLGGPADFTVTLTDFICAINDTTSPRTVNLPAVAAAANCLFHVKDTSGGAGTNHISITPNGSDRIDGVNAPLVINANYGKATVWSNGAAWFTL